MIDDTSTNQEWRDARHMETLERSHVLFEHFLRKGSIGHRLLNDDDDTLLKIGEAFWPLSSMITERLRPFGRLLKRSKSLGSYHLLAKRWTNMPSIMDVSDFPFETVIGMAVDSLIAKDLRAVTFVLDQCGNTNEIKGVIMKKLCFRNRLADIKQFVIDHDVNKDDVTIYDNYILQACCASGHFDILKWICHRFTITTSDIRSCSKSILAWCCISKNVDMTKWIVEHFGLTAADARSNDNEVLRNIHAYDSNLDVIKWIVDYFKLDTHDARANNNEALHNCCYHGKLKNAKWLSDRFQLTIEDARACEALLESCDQCDMVMARWLVDRFHLTDCDAEVVYHRTCMKNRHNKSYMCPFMMNWLEENFSLGI